MGFITILACETRVHTDLSDTVLKNNQSQLLDDLVAFHMQVSLYVAGGSVACVQVAIVC